MTGARGKLKFSSWQKLLGIIHTALARMLDAEIQVYMLRSLTAGRGENLLTEDNAPEQI